MSSVVVVVVCVSLGVEAYGNSKHTALLLLSCLCQKVCKVLVLHLPVVEDSVLNIVAQSAGQ